VKVLHGREGGSEVTRTKAYSKERGVGRRERYRDKGEGKRNYQRRLIKKHG